MLGRSGSSQSTFERLAMKMRNCPEPHTIDADSVQFCEQHMRAGSPFRDPLRSMQSL